MFGQVLEKLDSWFGRSFLLASYFPWLIFAVANAVMAEFMAPETARYVASYFGGGLYGAISGVVSGAAAVAALAYLSDPLVWFMTRFLEGGFYPRFVTEWLSTDQSLQLRDLDERAQTALDARALVQSKTPAIREKILAARLRGVPLGAICKAEAIDEAARKLRPLADCRDRQRAIAVEALEDAALSLTRALESNCADVNKLAPPASAAEVKAAWRLQALYSSMRGVTEYADNRADYEVAVTSQQKEGRFSINELPATRFGNEAAALRSFVETRFQIDFDFFWPIVQIVLQGDDKASGAVVGAKQQLDFCIRIFWFTIAFTALWLVVAALNADSLFAPPLIGTAGFVAAALWLEIVHTSYHSFAELVRSVIVLKRFDVMKALHLGLPKTWSEEKEAWRQAADQLKWGSETAISYAHPDK